MNRARTTLTIALIAGMLGLLMLSGSSTGQDVKAAGKPMLVAGGLDNPSGVVVHPTTGHVFVASHDGVTRINPRARGKERKKLEIGGYPTDIYGKGPKYNIGPLGLAWLDNDHLVVGDGSRKDGSELVRIYKIGKSAPDKPRKETDAAYTLGPIAPSENSPMGEGNFYGIAVGKAGIFVTCNGDDTKGWVSRIPLEGGKPGKLAPFIKTKVATGVDAPVGITYTPDGNKLCVSQMGEMNIPGDSLLTFYDPKSGKLLAKHKTGLHDIAGVAYSPKTGKLYAVDFAWVKTGEGGLFRLDVAGDEVKATKIAKLDRPTALAFDKNGNLYVTVFGWGTGKKGAVVRFPAGL